MQLSSGRVWLRVDEFDRLTTARGWTTDAERARQIGVTQVAIHYLRAHKRAAGSKVIHKMLTALQAPYASLFEAEAGDEQKDVA